MGLHKLLWKAFEAMSGFERRESGSSKLFLKFSGPKEIDQKVNLFRSAYEVELRSVLKARDINLVLDVGANRGDFSSFLRNQVGYSGKIISFEPVPGAFRRLQEAAAGDPLWEVQNLALGSRDTILEINVAESSEFSSFLESNQYSRDQFGQRAVGSQKKSVAVRRMDGFLRNEVPDLVSKRIFLKIDTQGYDLEVYGGLGETLKHIVALQSEVSVIPIYKEMPSWLDSLSFFNAQGFQTVGLFPVTRDGLRVIEFDYLLIRDDS
jgi:FkbM family methyltransferase